MVGIVQDGMHDGINLGPCCCCGAQGFAPVNVILLNKLSPILGRGWGCLQCGVPSNGASAVVCDSCMREHDGQPVDTWLKWACRGYPAIDGRIPFPELEGEFDHDMQFHPEVEEGD